MMCSKIENQDVFFCFNQLVELEVESGVFNKFLKNRKKEMREIAKKLQELQVPISVSKAFLNRFGANSLLVTRKKLKCMYFCRECANYTT